MVRRALAAALLAVSAFAAGCAHPDTHVPPLFPEPAAADAARSEAAFRSLASLAGTWEGDFSMGESKGRDTVDYRVTAGGSAIEEILFRGKPHEMVTLYHLDSGRLLLTHYCAAGNQPTMVLAPGDDPADLKFAFLRGSNMAAGDGHMHEARFQLLGPDQVKTTWTYWEEGKPGHAAVFELRRAK